MENISWEEADKNTLQECAVHFAKILYCSQGFEVFQPEKTSSYFIAKAPDHGALKIYTAFSINDEPIQFMYDCETDACSDPFVLYVCIVRYTDTAPEYYFVSAEQWNAEVEFWKNLKFDAVTMEVLEQYHWTKTLPIYLD